MEKQQQKSFMDRFIAGVERNAEISRARKRKAVVHFRESISEIEKLHDAKLIKTVRGRYAVVGLTSNILITGDSPLDLRHPFMTAYWQLVEDCDRLEAGKALRPR